MLGHSTEKESASLEQAEVLRAKLTADIQGIQAQLGDRQRTHEDGRRLTSKEYWSWRRQAQYSLNKKLGELRNVKGLIRAKKSPASSAAKEAAGTEETNHLNNLHDILFPLVDEGVFEFSREELEQIDAAKDFLLRAGIPRQTIAA